MIERVWQMSVAVEVVCVCICVIMLFTPSTHVYAGNVILVLIAASLVNVSTVGYIEVT